MALWITRKKDNDGAYVLRLEGQIVDEWVEVLQVECRTLLEQGVELTLDLDGVTYVDREGIDELRGLIDQGVDVVNHSGLIRELLGR